MREREYFFKYRLVKTFSCFFFLVLKKKIEFFFKQLILNSKTIIFVKLLN